MKNVRPHLLLSLALFLPVSVVGMGTARAESYPSRIIKIVVPVPAGGSLDVTARFIGEKLTAAWGQPVIVENKPGANGIIGITAAAKAPADGYTVLMSISTIVMNPVLYPSASYKLEDLAPISLLNDIPVGFAINAAQPANTLAEFVQLVRSKPRQYSYGSYGAGSAANVFGEMLNAASGMDLVHVAYKGEAPVVADLLGGTVQSGFASAGVLARHAKAGKVKLLAITGGHRLKALPDIPTFKEAGYPTMDLTGWFGVFVPAGTPKPIVESLSSEIQRVVGLPDVSQKIIALGYEPVGSSAAQFASFLKTDAERWAAVIRQFNIKVQ